MEILTQKVKQKIKAHALSEPDNECCGIIVSPLVVIPCKNIAPDKEVHFIISNIEVEKARKKGELLAVYHSHITKKEADGFSSEDEIIAEYFNVRYILYSISEDKFYEYTPSGKPIDYLNRPYVYKVLDEVTLIKDYYKKELNIEITNLKNRANPELFLKENGFVETGEFKKYEIVLIHQQNDPLKPKLLLHLGNNKLIIHPEYERSKVIDYNYGLQKWTKKVYKHSKM